jgi:hypothetical protein
MEMTTKSMPTETNGDREGKDNRPGIDRYGGSMSIDSYDSTNEKREFYKKYPHGHPSSPHGHHMGHGQFPYGNPYHYSNFSRHPPQRNLRSVITTSFSIDEERDRGYSREQRMESEDLRQEIDDRDDWVSPKSGKRMYYSRTSPTFLRHSSRVSPMSRDMNSPHSHHHMRGPSPRGPMGHRPPFVQRSYSSGYFASPLELKRSYYHHSRPHTRYPSNVPPDFLPPKRPKIDASPSTKKEIVVTPDAPDDSKSSDTWSPRSKDVNRSNSFPMPPSWNGKPYPMQPSPSMMYGGGSHSMYPYPGFDDEDSPREWHAWSPEYHASPRFWDSPRSLGESDAERAWGSPPRERIGYRRESDTHRHVSFERRVARDDFDSDRQSKTEALAFGKDDVKGESSSKHLCDASMMLLALPQDRVALSETLCVVRENIEVFTAKLSDVNAPAPGRKHAVVVGQVGLRCIHCRHTKRSCDRIKRAVCYPSSIKRIYRTVIDMKLDHFSQCKYVPMSLKNKLDELKAIHTRSTGTTMSYFCNAAKLLGMEDAANGVVLRENATLPRAVESTTPLETNVETSADREPPQDMIVTRSDASFSSSLGSQEGDRDPPQRVDSMSIDSVDSTSRSATLPSGVLLENSFEGLVPLALSEDKTALSPLRCFLREQVCAFSATEKDIAARAPTTFSIIVGQVGIGCIHCVKQAAPLRSNRAVCFPFSIARIYQSVADIQRFHFGECKNMPNEVKNKFLELQSASSKGSKGLATRQYWVTSARKLGLVDTAQGIRFGRDPTKPESSKSFSLDMLAQVAFSVTTASKQLVHPSDKPCIAEFLYVVMEQLQPCRFTEADRNKRRLKDVGCIGVECKHCAGQVDSRKFFWSSVSAVESNFVSVHTHMLECRMVPDELKEKLTELKRLRKEQTAVLKTGSQKAFFARVWNRLHEDECSDSQTSNDGTTEIQEEKTHEESVQVLLTEKLAGLSTDSVKDGNTETQVSEATQNELQAMPTDMIESHVDSTLESIPESSSVLDSQIPQHSLEIALDTSKANDEMTLDNIEKSLDVSKTIDEMPQPSIEIPLDASTANDEMTQQSIETPLDASEANADLTKENETNELASIKDGIEKPICNPDDILPETKSSTGDKNGSENATSSTDLTLAPTEIVPV